MPAWAPREAGAAPGTALATCCMVSLSGLGAEAIHRHHGPGGVRGGVDGERALELGAEAGENGGGAGEDGVALEQEGREGGDEADGEEGVVVVVVVVETARESGGCVVVHRVGLDVRQ